MPSTALNTFTQLKLEPLQNPDLARSIAVKLKASTTFTLGEILGEIAATPGIFAKYDPTANDGTEVPKGLAMYSCITDASGNPTGVTFPYPPFPEPSMPMYVRGEFDCALITAAMGDSGALLTAALGVPGFGALEYGTVAVGTMRLG